MELVLIFYSSSLSPIWFKASSLMFIHGSRTHSTISYCSLFDYMVNITIDLLFLHVRKWRTRTYMFARSDTYIRILRKWSFGKFFTFFPRAEPGHSE